MTCNNTWAEALDRSNNCQDPVGAWVQSSETAKRWYTKHPLSSRMTMISVNAVFGFIKPFLLPITAAVAVVVQPILAGYNYFWKGESQNAKQWLKAWCFSVLALSGIAAFMAVSACHMTLLQGTALVVTGCTVSIIIHVYRVSHTTKPKEFITKS